MGAFSVDAKYYSEPGLGKPRICFLCPTFPGRVTLSPLCKVFWCFPHGVCLGVNVRWQEAGRARFEVR